MSPSTGQLGTVVVIKGEGLFVGSSGIQQVLLSGTEARIVLSKVSRTSVEVEVQTDSEGTVGVVGDVVIISDDGTRVVKQSGWTYLADGIVERVQPSSGQVGTLITISGQRFKGGSTTITSVTLGGVDPRTADRLEDTELVIVAASASAGKVDVVITALSGAIITGKNMWEYLEQSKIDDVTLSEGTLGTEIEITGTNMLGGGSRIQSITLAGSSATITAGKSDTAAHIVAPLSTPRQGDIKLVADSGAETILVNGWSFNAHGEVTKMSPSSGHLMTLVTIHGRDLLGGGDTVRSLTLAGIAVYSVNDATDDRIVVIANESSAAILDGNVVITSNTGATLTAEKAWSYVPPGVVTVVSPGFGQFGTRVEIRGKGLLGRGCYNRDGIHCRCRRGHVCDDIGPSQMPTLRTQHSN